MTSILKRLCWFLRARLLIFWYKTEIKTDTRVINIYLSFLDENDKAKFKHVFDAASIEILHYREQISKIERLLFDIRNDEVLWIEWKRT